MDYQSSGFSTPAAVRQKLIKKRWVIATFPDSNDYSVIPTNWILKTVNNDGNRIEKCVWPPTTFNVTSDFLKEAVEPLDDWNTYRINLYENGKEYSDFSKAWYKHVELSEESASEVEQQLLNMKNKNKRLYGQSSMIREDSDTSSDDEGINIFKQKKIIKGPKSVMPEQTTVDTVSEHQYTELSNVNLIPSTSSENVPLNTTKSHSFNIPQEQFFISIGGNSVKDNIKRVLTKTFSNEFAIRCSWTGRGKDISTKLCDSKIVVVLKKCIKNSQKDYSDAIFETILADWFRYATTRHKRSLE